MITFGFETEGIDVVRHFSDNVAGRIFAITGTSAGGIGAETAISLAHGNPSQIILLGRNQSRIDPVIASIAAINPSVTVKFVPVDLSSLASTRAAAATILADASIPHIDVLINNAAVMACPLTRTTDGFELQLAAAHIGHFLLTNLLLSKISVSGGARIVTVSSVANTYSDIRLDDPNYVLRPDEYSEFGAYGQAKTANVLFTTELRRRLAGRGITAYSLHPGGVASNLGQYMTPEVKAQAMKKVAESGKPLRHKNLQQGCSTTLRAALDASLDGHDGFYLNDCQVTSDKEWLAPWAVDEENARKCWEMTEELVGEKFL
ncbi:hypothetical protein QBC47DRAFT_460854 [Echria macrotheca]|uniref:Short-chain dehydrogenase n=1 Tax=Echria macrotheca TaxID=438768 RepID=A0AAJ0BCT4_9PEZI|nr:hypothetical protein QBC47DRAFT_460854 [Echria macrotheca]